MTYQAMKQTLGIAYMACIVEDYQTAHDAILAAHKIGATRHDIHESLGPEHVRALASWFRLTRGNA